MIVEYALKSSTIPIGVATYNLLPELPEALQGTTADFPRRLRIK